VTRIKYDTVSDLLKRLRSYTSKTERRKSLRSGSAVRRMKSNSHGRSRIADAVHGLLRAAAQRRNKSVEVLAGEILVGVLCRGSIYSPFLLQRLHLPFRGGDDLLRERCE
jgi:hypothetical protein